MGGIKMKRNRIALDFMGALNDPKAKGSIWKSVQDALKIGDIDALKEAGISTEQLNDFQRYIEESGCSPMQLRDYTLQHEGVKVALGRYTSIGAEAGQLDHCSVYDDAVDFMAIAFGMGYRLELFSTIKAPEGYRSLQEIMLANKTLSEAQQKLTSCVTALDLIDDVVVSELKKSEPGIAVYQETKAKNLHLYVDDEVAVIDGTVREFRNSDGRVTLPVLCRVERKGVKDPGYQIPMDHNNIGEIVVANKLIDQDLIDTLYR